jgi:F-box/leucine-rich repeat protein 2/20
MSCEFGQEQNSTFSRRIRQIGEVYYTPSYENEEIRHLKKLPNSIITEQNLIE